MNKRKILGSSAPKPFKPDSDWLSRMKKTADAKKETDPKYALGTGRPGYTESQTGEKLEKNKGKNADG